jgi:hypothetical protein
MHVPFKSSIQDEYDWSRPSYKVRVRGTVYLWGSATLNENISFQKPLLLHLRNDLFGEPVTFGTQVATGAQTTVGTLQPGQCVSIPVQGISGVFALCAEQPVPKDAQQPVPRGAPEQGVALETFVDCLIRE